MKEIKQEGMCRWKTEQDGIIYDYSGSFKTVTDACSWYLKHGRWLEEHFNRELIFVQT